MFAAALDFIRIPTEENDDFRFYTQTVLPLFASLKKRQIKWIKSDKEMTKSMLIYIKNHQSIRYNLLDEDQVISISYCNIFLYKKINNVYNEREIRNWIPQIKTLRWDRRIDGEDIHFLNDMRIMVENQHKQCGNFRCCKNYQDDKYGAGIDKTDESWRNRKVINKWYICKGCRSMYYCGRKCQKISWKYGHRRQCKKLQKLIVIRKKK